MGNEGFEADEWDADFIDKLVRAEEEALSTTQIPHHHPPPPAPPPWDVSYSPPRELSQRTHEAPHAGRSSNLDYVESLNPRVTQFAKEHEIDRLKKELNLVSKQLNVKEQECLELRKEKNKMVEELHSRIEVKDATSLRTNNLETISEACQNAPTNELPTYGTKSRNIAGVHTENNSDSRNSDNTNDLYGSEKLLGLWSSSGKKLGSALVPKLLATCEMDFHVLFGYLNDSNNALSNGLNTTQSIEAAKISHLYSILTKICSKTSKLEDLLESLIDLCSLKKVAIVHRSLHVLHMILTNSSSMEKSFVKRENVVIEESISKTSNSQINGCGYFENKGEAFANLAEILNQANIPCGLAFSNDKTCGSIGFFDNNYEAPISSVYWVSLFQRLSETAIVYKEDQIRHEALSIMKLILLRSNAYSEREKFAVDSVFQGLSQLMRREAGVSVQYQAVDILYMLFNCPNVMTMFGLGFKEDGEYAYTDANGEKGSNLYSQWLEDMLIGLADCLACSGSATTEEKRLRRNALVFLAFLGSSGKSGFEIFLNFRLPKGTDLVAIILQGLVSDLDQEALKSAKSFEFFIEQTLLIREVLIFFNRLVSHPQYSIPILQSLTKTRDMASMTVDVANRLTNKAELLWQHDSKFTKQIRESEIIELAQVFKKRVYIYLGDSIS